MQEYERAVIFRLGRLLSGGAKGPGKINTIGFRENIINLFITVQLMTVHFVQI